MRYLKQSTSVDVGIGPFLDDADGKTAETALTITQPDIRLKKNGGAWAQKNAAQTLSHEENGWYEVTLDATDTDTLGILLVAVHEAGALPVWAEFHVVTANVYDSLFGSGDVLDVSVTQWTGTNVGTPDTAGYPKVTVKTGTGTGEINASSGKVPATIAAGDVAALAIPQYTVVADAIYTNGKIDLSAALLLNGAVDTSVSNARASLYTLAGVLVDSFTTVALPDDQGIFRFPQLTRTLSAQTMYYAIVTIEDSTTGGTDRSAAAFLKRYS